MNPAFLKTLIGLTVREATRVVLERGHEPYVIPEICQAVPAIALSNTVVLWQKEGKISDAHPGDPLEVP